MPGARLQSVRWFYLALAMAFTPSSAPAWGPLAHQIVYRAAIEQLAPNEFRDWLQRNSDTGARQSMTPDIDWNPFRAENLSLRTQRRMTTIGANERGTHYFDSDLILPGAGPQREALRQTTTYAEALKILTEELAKHSESAPLMVDLPALGSVPWRVAQVWRLLIDALKAKDFERAHLYAAALTHYAADSTMVLHGDSRYDGISSLTNGKGLHLSYEMWGFENDLEKKGAVRPKDSMDVWKVPPELVTTFVSKTSFPRPKNQKEVVAGTLDQLIANQGVIEPLSNAYGASHGTDNVTKGAALYAATIHTPGFSGTVQQLSQQRVTDAAAFSAALLDSAYAQAVAESGVQKIEFPAEPIAFDRVAAVKMYPPPEVGPSTLVPLPLNIPNPTGFRCPLTLGALGL